ncbi:helix-turn-helix domain-containing protein [Streptomyces albidus (ex Kaewkla and Franco 2022)]|uniref:helix-turn-helix domain-containing protein n=1 Tax=Streptomyces albidus (ex Kaewkla and Franco 2022) TaxID=722709 RepID=UPI0015EE4295|nr:helix-turn-helix transcriptional regulator [Streptomyces albidus (ex Kaewkla and Franco 2022)]
MPAPKELDPSASLAALYGAKLRKLRTRAGWTQRELGDRVPVAHSRIAQFELGNETPPEDVSAKLDALLGADGDLADLWEHVRRTPFPDWARRFVAYEARATAMHKYMAHSVPGLLQTEAYASAMLGVGRVYGNATDRELEEKLTARIARQSILESPTPPWLWVVLDEAVLHRGVGGQLVMRAQLMRLLEVAALPRITLQILPYARGAHPGMGGSVTLLTLPGSGQVAYLEGINSGTLVEPPGEVEQYAIAYDLLQANALPPEESAELVRKVVEDTYPCPLRAPT